MKRFSVITFFVIFSLPIFAFAQQITYNQAKTAAVNALKYEGWNVSENMVATVLTKQVEGHSLIYEVRFHNGILVLVSGHSICSPILGIVETSISNVYTSLFDEFDSLPPALQDLLEYYMNQILICFEDSLNYDTHPNWSALSVYDDTLYSRAIIVGPLLSSKWGQNISNDLSNQDIYAYNYYVHNYSNNNDTTCTNTPAGCVAVAMGQILRYWSSLGFFAYEPNMCWGYVWSNMPAELLYQNGSNPQYEEQRNAVAALLRDCGTSVGMEYSCTESVVPYDSVYVISRALRNYGFLSNLEKMDTVLPNEWNYQMQDDLNNGYPILYLGIGTGGHAFVCDGYMVSGNIYFYHFNWGWRGYFDGWFTLDDLTPGTLNNYSDTQYAIFNIHPSSCWENIVFGCDKYFTFNNATYSAEETIQNNYHVFSVMQESFVTLKAGEEIVLTDGFYAGNGANFVAKIEACEPDDFGMNGLGDDAIGERGLRGDASSRDAVHHVSTPTTNADGLRLHPNPAHNTLTVESESPVRTITIYDLTGKTMLTVENCQSPATVNVVSLPRGIYLLRAVTEEGVKTARFVKN